MGIIVNILLLMLTSIVLFIGIQFYIRNKVTSNKTRYYVLGYCIFSGIWCLCYGLIGLCDDFNTAMIFRACGVVAINGFSIVQVFLLAGMSRDVKWLKIGSRVFAVLIGITDTVLFSNRNVAEFVRIGNWTTWVSNPEYKLVRYLHSSGVALYIVIMFFLGVRWYRSNSLKRQKRFIICVFVANFCMLFFTIPDTLLPMFGRYVISTSGIGAALCAVVIWYGASTLNTFDINVGNVFEKIYRFIDAGVLVFDMDYNLVLSNPFGEKLIAKNKKNKVRLEDLFYANEEQMQKFFSDTANGIVSSRFEAIIDHRIYSLKNTILMDNYNEPYCYLCVLSDVTDEINMVNELEEANNAKTKFLTSISHEIRTPINAVLGFSEILSGLTDDKEMITCTDNISRAGELLLSIINDLLDMSKITSGNMSIEAKEYDLADVLSDVYLLHSVKAAEKGLSFQFENDEYIPKFLIGDSLRIQQIITNLISNSIKYTNQGTVKLALDYREKDNNCIDLIITAKDTGIGIREEDMPYLFDAFSRFDNEKNKHIQGTGVGLSITKKLIEGMSGSIEVDSEYGAGTCFTVVIPQEVVSRDPLGKITSLKSKLNGDNREENRFTAPDACILAVDDNPMNLMVFGGLVKPLGINVDTASEGRRTIEMIKDKKYDIIFLDHMMPDMDGIEVLKHIKADKHHLNTETPIIMMTANCIEGAREEYLKVGFDDFVGKPVKKDALSAVIKQYINPDLIIKTNEDESIEYNSNNEPGILKIPISGIDWQMAFSYTPDYELLSEIIHTFCALADKEMGELGSFFEKIVQGEAGDELLSYRIKVHALKNSLALVGAQELSDFAKTLENACKENNIRFIEENHENFAKEYLDLAMRLRLAVTGSLSESRKTMSNDELLTNLDMIQTALDEFDLTALNEMSFALDLFSYETETIASYISEIQNAITNLEQEKIIQSIDDLRNILTR